MRPSVLFFAFACFLAASPAIAARVSAPSCPAPSAYAVSGPDRAKAGVAQEYALVPASTGSGAKPEPVPFPVAFSVWRDGKKLDAASGEKFPHIFSEPGTYRVDAAGKDPRGCAVAASLPVRVFDRFFAYVGDGRDGLDLGFEDKFAARSELFRRFLVDPGVSGGAGERALAAFDQADGFLVQADRVVVDMPDVAAAFQALAKWSKAHGADLSKKELYVVSGVSDNFLNRVLAANAQAAGVSRVSAVRQGALLDVLAALSVGKAPSAEQVSPFTVSFAEASKLYVFSYAVDSVLYAGFPPDLLGLLLALSVMCLVVAFANQVLGLSAFGTYYPVLFALSLSAVGVGTSLLLLAAALLAGWSVQLFTRRIHLLHTAKKATFFVTYLALTVAALALDRSLGWGWADYAVFSNAFALFPVITAAVVAERLFDEDVALWTRSGWLAVAEFSAVTGALYFLAQWTGLRYFLLAYPEMLIVVLASCVLVGRFTGLQAVEYFRFLPVLKKKGEEE